MKPRYSLARRKAVELLKQARVAKAPVPVEKLAALLNAQIVRQPFTGEISGVVHRNADGSAVIGVNSSHRITRQRFTIAHELAHLTLHADKELHIDERFPIGLRSGISGKAVDHREIEANQFAAELLMPRELMIEDLRPLIGLDTVIAIQKMAMKYKVSTEAMSIRLSALGYVEL
jgi:Zn-dependent peptidase ImmA (M78 family)